MVVITNGSSIFEVTKGAYETIYKKQGFGLYNANVAASPTVNNAKKSIPPVADLDTDIAANEDVEVGSGVYAKLIVLEEKPIGHWTKDDVKFYAKEKGIDLSGTKNVNEAKELVKKFIENAAK